MRYLVTGGAGFIGSNYIHYLLEKYQDIKIINLDKLTYAGNLENLKDVENDSRYKFVKGDIGDVKLVDELVQQTDVLVNFAAESHVDRSIGTPDAFIKTDIFGTFVLLEACRKHGIQKFVQISTDEVYGSIETGAFREDSPLMPSSPYSASKAGADRLAYSYQVTYKLPVIITRCSNNYGPNQYPEKLIPLFVTNALEGKNLPIYGDGKNVRDWIFVLDHCDAVDFVIHHGEDGEVYNIGGGNERTNLEITDIILKELHRPTTLKTYVKDRPGHDLRYAVDCSKLKKMGWQPQYQFEQGMKLTINWYTSNQDWWKKIKSGEYLNYYRQQYQIS
ncbi:dTDP-glucose 4,6-dehydratase [candidate division KSB1 bacterium]|nr:dTDP-glucose 4,6-dehydratase [candidate division KSB1 bacterium]